MKRVLSLMLALMLVLSLVVVPTAVVADEADPYAGYDKWDGVTYDTTPFNGITANNGGNDVTGGPVIIDTAAKLAGFAKLVNDAGVLATTGYGAYHNLPIYITKNIDSKRFPI